MGNPIQKFKGVLERRWGSKTKRQIILLNYSLPFHKTKQRKKKSTSEIEQNSLCPAILKENIHDSLHYLHITIDTNACFRTELFLGKKIV